MSTSPSVSVCVCVCLCVCVCVCVCGCLCTHVHPDTHRHNCAPHMCTHTHTHTHTHICTWKRILLLATTQTHGGADCGRPASERQTAKEVRPCRRAGKSTCVCRHDQHWKQSESARAKERAGVNSLPPRGARPRPRLRPSRLSGLPMVLREPRVSVLAFRMALLAPAAPGVPGDRNRAAAPELAPFEACFAAPHESRLRSRASPSRASWCWFATHAAASRHRCLCPRV
jgi:hypothetical protein